MNKETRFACGPEEASPEQGGIVPMTVTLNVHEAKTHLSRLLKRVQEGEEIVIAKSGRPVARLVPIAQPLVPRKPGSAAGMIVVSDDFDTPLPESILEAFEQ
jgi:prevent-host-death family protein